MTTVETFTFTLPAKPVAKGRPRATRNGRMYTDAKTRAAEQSILAVYLLAGGNTRQPHAGPVRVKVEATFVPPTSWPKWKRELALAGLWPHTTKPDFDNLIKTIDGLNGVAWLDDSQIFEGQSTKRYGTVAQTVYTIWFHPAPSKPTKEKHE